MPSDDEVFFESSEELETDIPNQSPTEISILTDPGNMGETN